MLLIFNLFYPSGWHIIPCRSWLCSSSYSSEQMVGWKDTETQPRNDDPEGRKSQGIS